MPRGGQRQGAGRPRNNQEWVSLQIRVPAQYKDQIKELVNQKLKELKQNDTK